MLPHRPHKMRKIFISFNFNFLLFYFRSQSSNFGLKNFLSSPFFSYIFTQKNRHKIKDENFSSRVRSWGENIQNKNSKQLQVLSKEEKCRRQSLLGENAMSVEIKT